MNQQIKFRPKLADKPQTICKSGKIYTANML